MTGLDHDAIQSLMDIICTDPGDQGPTMRLDIYTEDSRSHLFDIFASPDEVRAILHARVPVPIDPAMTLSEAVEVIRATIPGWPVLFLTTTFFQTLIRKGGV